MNRSYKYLLKPTKEQKDKINQNFKLVSLLYEKYRLEKKNGKNMKVLAKFLIKDFLIKYPQLNKADRSSLMNLLFQLYDSECHKKVRVSTKHSYKTSCISQYGSARLLPNGHLHLPKVGDVKIVMHRELPDGAEIKSFTITRSKTKEYYACILFDVPICKNNPELDINNCIGFDYSAKNFLVDNYGNIYDAPRFLREKMDVISRHNKYLSSCIPGTVQYKKANLALAKIHERVKRKRIDYLHKISREVVDKYDYIFLESLDMNQLAENSNSFKSMYDYSFKTFVDYLTYKAEEKGKKVIQIDHWFASSKTCHVCGYIKKDLSLDDREWTCVACGTTHDRDVNAAINIVNEGRKSINTVGPTV